MKRPGLFPHPLAATLFLGSLVPAGPAAAQENSLTAGMAMGSSTSAAGRTRAAELLRRYDRNGDGRLDDDERDLLHEEFVRERLEKGPPPGEAAAKESRPAGAASRKRESVLRSAPAR